VQVKGKTHAVPIFELLGRAGEVPPDRRRQADDFAAAVAAFQRRDWSGARARFAQLQAQFPADRAVQLYRTATETCAAHPPDDTWSGALELQEK
jgi:adenylate cyclase